MRLIVPFECMSPYRGALVGSAANTMGEEIEGSYICPHYYHISPQL
jgi:hypothetical protein